MNKFIRKVLSSLCLLLPTLNIPSTPPTTINNNPNRLAIYNDSPSIEHTNSETLKTLHENNFYRFVVNDINYYVTCPFKTNIDGELSFIRTMEDFSLYPYEKEESLDLTKKIIETQTYNQSTNEFKKTFEYISEEKYIDIISNALSLDDQNSNEKESIIKSFQMETDYKRKKSQAINSSCLKSAPIKTNTSFYSTNNQDVLNYYIETKKYWSDTSKIMLNNRSCQTIDDPIVQIIPRLCFTNINTYSAFGTEWGFYVNTFRYTDTKLTSEVFVFDTNIRLDDEEDNYDLFTISPVVNSTFIYDTETDIISYLNENDLYIKDAFYTTNITYISDYTETYNDYDELEYVPINEHPLNPNETGYNEKTDNGIFFGNHGFNATASKKTTSIASAVHDFIIDATIDITTFISEKALSKKVPGYLVDGIGLITDAFKNSVNSLFIPLIIKSNGTPKIFEVSASNTKNTLNYYKASSNTSIDWNSDGKAKMKFCTLDLSDTDAFILKRNDDQATFYTQVIKSIFIDSSYKALISHAIDFTLYKDSFKSEEGFDFFNNIGYTLSPARQTETLKAKGVFNINTHAEKVELDSTSKDFILDFESDENATYTFNFYNLPTNTKIYRSGNVIFESGCQKVENNFGFSAFQGLTTHTPLTAQYKTSIYINKGSHISFSINRYHGSDYKSGKFHISVYKITDQLSDNNQTASPLDNTTGTYAAKSSKKTLEFRPKYSGCYTFSMLDNVQSASFYITDSKNRIIYQSAGQTNEFISVITFLSDITYYIHYNTYSTPHDICFRFSTNKYLPSKMKYDTNDFCYSTKTTEDYSYIFIPAETKRFSMTITTFTAYATINIYNKNRQLLVSSSNPINFNYTFTNGEFYVIQVKYNNFYKIDITYSYLRIKGV